jgi:predicted DNA binding CopG/RHH family protein
MNRNVMKTLPKTAEELDRRFDAGEDLESLGFDLSKATRPGLETKRINIDLPTNFLEALDEEAARRGITRQSLIKVWLYERLHGDSVARQRTYEQTLAVLFALATKQGGRGKKALGTSGEKEDRPLNVLDLAQELRNELFFHSIRARRVSDEDMQSVWAKILAEEAKKPGSFSKRTVAFVETLDKDEANLFNELCRFVVYGGAAGENLRKNPGVKKVRSEKSPAKGVR